MSKFNFVTDHFHRRAWNDTWDYPQSGSLIALDKYLPALSPFYFSWEVNYAPWAVISFTRTHYWISPVFCVLYLLFVWLGPKLMENRKPFDLRTPLKYWNLALALFSLWGSIRMVPHILVYIYRFGFLTTLCVPPIWSYASGSSGFWLMLFVFSKFLELIDTVFIVLRKKNLSFLHWYHHSTVLLYTWEGFVGEQAPGIHFCAMNYSIHAIMYFYYYLAAANKKPPTWGMLVTLLQIIQMITGVSIAITTLFLSYRYRFLTYTTAAMAFKPFDSDSCYVERRSVLGSLAIYATYVYLFGLFFWNRYVFKAPKLKKQE